MVCRTVRRAWRRKPGQNRCGGAKKYQGGSRVVFGRCARAGSAPQTFFGWQTAGNPCLNGEKFSLEFLISILVKHFGFNVVSQRGSHVKLRRASRVTIVPLHKELAPGTLKSVLALAGIQSGEFLKAIDG